MTGGRRPDAPSGRSGADLSLADLGAIKGCDALLDLVAGRRLGTPLARRDPALAVLSLLAADVDGTGPARRSAAARPPSARRPPAHRAPAHRARQSTVAAIVASALAALILAVMVAGTTSLMAASTLARLTWPSRSPARPRGR